MTNIELIRNSVDELKAMAYDYEMAHSFEDNLREQVLKDIAEGAENPAELAKEVLKTSEVIFPRYCA